MKRFNEVLEQKFMKLNNMSYEDLAEELETTVRDLRTMLAYPNFNTCEKLAKIFNTSPQLWHNLRRI